MTPVVFQKKIYIWWKKNKRELPLRKTIDPYKIMVSELMLQQTQALRVIPKYNAFVKRFPTVTILAKAKITDVLALWSGLGYNRRALFLHRTAQAVVANHKAIFPKSYEQLISLPG